MDLLYIYIGVIWNDYKILLNNIIVIILLMNVYILLHCNRLDLKYKYIVLYFILYKMVITLIWDE